MNSPRYRKLTIADRDALETLVRQNTDAVNTTSWQGFLCDQLYSDTQYALVDGCLIDKPVPGNDEVWCMCPLGAPEDSRRMRQKIYDRCNRQAMGVVFNVVSTEQAQAICEQFGDRVTVMDRRDAYCYLLSSKEQIEMQGSRFSDRRRRIRRFSDTYQWTYADLTSANLQEIASLNDFWYSTHDQSTGNIEGERECLQFMLENYDTLGMEGGLLYADGKVIAFCTGYPGSANVYHMLLQKALVEYRDAVQVLLHEFFSRHCTGFEYISESNDLGLEGLRFFKEQLRPTLLAERRDVRVAPTRKYTLRKLLRTVYRRLKKRAAPAASTAAEEDKAQGTSTEAH